MTVFQTNNRKMVKAKFKDLDYLNNLQLVQTARKGVKTKWFYELAETIKMSEKELATLINLSARTISNYKLQKKNLEPIYSEHLLKIVALFEKGEEVFGSIDEFNYWLNKPFWSSQQTPLGWLKTSGGVDLVTDELDKMSQGYPV